MKQIPITINETDSTDADQWRITFIGDYAVVTVNVEASYEDAITLAENLLVDYYDWDMSRFQTEQEAI